MNGQPVKEKPWKAGPSELHLALSEAGTVPLRWNHHHQDTLGKEGTHSTPTRKLAAPKTRLWGKKNYYWQPWSFFVCFLSFFFFFPNTLLIDEPIISLPKAFLKLNKWQLAMEHNAIPYTLSCSRESLVITGHFQAQGMYNYIIVFLWFLWSQDKETNHWNWINLFTGVHNNQQKALKSHKIIKKNQYSIIRSFSNYYLDCLLPKGMGEERGAGEDEKKRNKMMGGRSWGRKAGETGTWGKGNKEERDRQRGAREAGNYISFQWLL